MKIICISGKAQHGKDTFAHMLHEELVNRGKRVLVTHNADLLKFICKNFFGWNGEKDEAGRHILQYVGTDVIRQKEPTMWVDFLIHMMKLFPDSWDYVLIPDTRFPNELARWNEEGFDMTHIRIQRPNFDNGLSEEAKRHITETALDDATPDIEVTNNGTKDELRDIAKQIAEKDIV